MKLEDTDQLWIDKMNVSDIPGVQVIERHSFTTPGQCRLLLPKSLRMTVPII